MNLTQWFSQLNLGTLRSGIIILTSSLLCIIFHEVSHGVVALALGDPTAKNAGRLTFNPIKHVDIFGLLMMAMFRFGWAKAVPVDMRNFKHPVRDMAITAAAGPVSNIVLAFVALLVRAVAIFFYNQSGGVVSSFLVEFMEYTAILSVGLAVFNLIPISPLDGSKVLLAVLPEKWYYTILKYERFGFLILMALLFLGVLNTPLTVARTWLLNGLASITSFPYQLLQSAFG